MRIFLVLVLALLAPQVFAEGVECSPNIQHWLSKELPSLKTWQSINTSRKSNCDDGVYAEGYSDAVVVLLAHHWSSISKLAAIIKREPQFEEFVLRHIDATTDPDDLKQVQIQAGSRCPPKHNALCSSIGSAATLAINEL